MSEAKKPKSTWKQRSLNYLKSYYLGFAGTQWHEFDRKRDEDIILMKIAYPLFGPPSEVAKDVQSSYNTEQRKRAKEIVDLIFYVYDNYRVSKEIKLRIGFICVAGKHEEHEFLVPVFSVYIGGNSYDNDRYFVGTDNRVYKNWNDWKDNNALPKMDYAYPKRGYFTCRDKSYEFDPQKDPIIEYGSSPNSSGTSIFLKGMDVGASILGVGAGFIIIASCFTPLGPIVLTSAAIASTSCAVYGAGRGAYTLFDKGTHGQSLKDLESLTIWLSIVATPFSLASSYINGMMALGGQQGRIFSSSMRMLATATNFMTLGLDTALIGFGLANLIMKTIENGRIDPLDVLQFSMSIFFFTNTIIQPKVASKIIRQAQEMHFERTVNSMTDAQAKQALEKFMKQNGADGSIAERSHIIRTVNRMDDPSGFFKRVGVEADIGVNDRRGSTVNVTDNHGFTRSHRPNTKAKLDYRGKSTVQQQNTTNPAQSKPPKEHQRDLKTVEQIYSTNGGAPVKSGNITLNGRKIFDNLDRRQQRTLNLALRDVKKCANRDQLLGTAHGVAEALGCNTSDELSSVIQIIAKHVEGKSGTDLTHALSKLQSKSGCKQFADGIQSDIRKAERYAQRGELTFKDPLTAVYHYRKHGAEFPEMLKKYGDSFEVYVGPIRDSVLDSRNLREVATLDDGTVQYFYASKRSDEFGMVTSAAGGPQITTIYQKPGASADYKAKIRAFFKDHVEQGPPEPVKEAALRFARFLGLRSTFQIIVSVKDRKKPLKEWRDLDPRVEDQISLCLNAMTIE